MINLRSTGFPTLIAAFFMLILFSIDIRAQDSLRVEGGAKILEGGIITDSNENRDVNGVLTAGLLINSDLTGLQFVANNGIHKTRLQPGASLLYLSPNERVVEIYREGFIKFQLILAEYGIELESGKIWEITLTGDKQLTEAPVQFDFNTADVTLYIDGEIHQVDGETYKTQLAEGQHNIQVQKNTFIPIEDTITVSTQDVNIFPYTLESTPILFLPINSVPQGASIYLDNKSGSEGTTNNKIRVYPGLHTIELRKDGYITQVEEVQITPEHEKEGFTYYLQENAGYLTVNTTPSNAGLIVDGSVLSNKNNIKLIPGIHEIRVTATGHDPISKNITIELGDTLVENFELNMITGDLTVISIQEEAQITLRRGNEIYKQWQGSDQLLDLPAGNYTLQASLTNFRTETREIEILRDQDKTEQFNLTQISGKGSLVINGVFEDATVEIKGARYNRTFNSMPVNIPSLDWGAYDITISKEGFKTHTERKILNSFVDSLVFMDEFVPKTKGKAFIRSLFIPGLGHGYLDKGGRGFLYFLGSAAAIGFTYKSYMDYSKHSQAYFDAVDRYKTAPLGSNFPELKAEYTNAHAQAIKAKDNIKLGLMVFGAVKGLETLDLLLSRSNKKLLRKAKLNFDPNTNGISMKVDF